MNKTNKSLPAATALEELKEFFEDYWEEYGQDEEFEGLNKVKAWKEFVGGFSDLVSSRKTLRPNEPYTTIISSDYSIFGRVLYSANIKNTKSLRLKTQE